MWKHLEILNDVIRLVTFTRESRPADRRDFSDRYDLHRDRSFEASLRRYYERGQVG
ncbi:MAG TPA: hypothetical protein VMF90_13750 [Rhizobiaceae bacterium]|nr:hypothetical protein [Rhizobiaceae bacterium]